jgi:hypothetical protein
MIDFNMRYVFDSIVKCRFDIYEMLRKGLDSRKTGRTLGDAWVRDILRCRIWSWFSRNDRFSISVNGILISIDELLSRHSPHFGGGVLRGEAPGILYSVAG